MGPLAGGRFDVGRVALVAVVAGCACLPAAGRAATLVCRPAATVRIAHQLDISPRTVAASPEQGSNGMPQCEFRVARARGGGPHTRLTVTVNQDDGPQASWRLMRTVVEASQRWGGKAPSGWHPPIGISGLGPYASWFPELDALMATNRDRSTLLKVSIVWPRARRIEMLGLARAAIVPYRRGG